MASPDWTIKTVAQKKPVIIKKGQIFIPQYPIVLKKRPITNVIATQVDSGAKRKCLTLSNSLQSSVETLIINHTEAEQTPALNTNDVIVKQEEKEKTNYQTNVMCKSLVRCQKHQDLPEHIAEGLPRIGLAFDSIEAFQDYAAMHAKKWYFYYNRTDSRNLKKSPNYNPTKPTYILYSCKFNNRNYKSQSRGIRKRSISRVNCPAGVTLKCKVDDDIYKVQTVCHHHCHELSAELFSQTSHGYRLPQEIKDEIRDLALFNLDPRVAHRYIQSKTPGIDLKNTVYNVFVKVKRKNIKAEMSPQKVTEMIAKIKDIKANFSNSEPQNKKHRDGSSCQAAKKSQKTQKNSEASAETNADVSENSTIKTTRTYNKSRKTPKPRSLPPTKDRIADTTLHTTDTDSGTFNVFLHRLKPEEDFNTSNQVINELSKPQSTIADDDENEIQGPYTRLENLALPYDRTQMRCNRRHDELPEHQAEGLVKEGDSFSSIEEFARYAAEHALEWFFYYQICDSRNVKTSNRYNNQQKTWYNFACRFDKGRYKSQSTGVRKVKPKTIQCPAAVSMVCKPGENDFTVTYACHHHSHELSAEIFSREAHGYRLSLELKDEIRELVWFQLDTRLIRQYLLQKTGFDLKRTIINLLSKMRKERTKLNITPERRKEILKKIKQIKKNFSIPKRASRNKNQLQQEIDSSLDLSASDDEENNGSRVETRLNNMLYDQGLIQSIKELQEATGCEIQINSWPEMQNPNAEVSHLQEGLIEENHEVQHHGYNNNDIEIDEEQYSINENFPYVIQSVDAGTEFGEHDHPSGDKVVYLHIESINAQSIGEVEINSTENQYDENAQCKVACDDEPDRTNTREDENMVSCHQNIYYKGDITTTDIQDYETYQYQVSYTNETDGTTTYEDENDAQRNESIREKNTEVEYQGFKNEPYITLIDDTVVRSTYDKENTAQDGENTNYSDEVTKSEYQDFVFEENRHQATYTDDIDGTNISEEENTAHCSEENISYIEEITETIKQDFENNENENNYQIIYQHTNSEDPIIENDCLRKNYAQRQNRNTIRRDVGVQIELEIQEIEREFENIKRLELSMLKEVSDENTVSVSTRGRPKVVLREEIINRYNIEFYFNAGGVIPCLENIAINMGSSVVHLLKKLYQGEAVFKMVLGKTNKLDRKTVQLTYIPLTITFPFENYKYINTLREYKKICSKYSNMAISLENTVEGISADLKAANERIEIFQSQNEELLNVKKSYEDLLLSHDVTKQLLKQSQLDLEEAHGKNLVLSQKINKLEAILQEYIEGTESLKQNIEPTLNCQNPNKSSKERETTRLLRNLSEPMLLKCQQNSKIYMTVSNDKQKTFQVKSMTNVKIIEKIKTLEKTVKVSNADMKRYREKIRKLEDLYLFDRQSLLGNIKKLEEELYSLKMEFSITEISEKSLQSQISISELESNKLREQIESLEKLKSFEKRVFLAKIKKLFEMITSLKQQLKEAKLKNLEGQNSCNKTICSR